MRDEASSHKTIIKHDYHILSKRFNRSGVVATKNGYVTGISHIDKILYAVKHKLSSPLASLIMARSYDKTHNVYLDSRLENTLSQVLFRESENTLSFINVNSIVEEFLKNDINKFYGLNIKEYLNLNRVERNILVTNAIEKMKQLDEAMQEIQNNKQKT